MSLESITLFKEHSDLIICITVVTQRMSKPASLMFKSGLCGRDWQIRSSRLLSSVKHKFVQISKIKAYHIKKLCLKKIKDGDSIVTL